MLEKIQSGWSNLRYSSLFPWIVAMCVLGFMAVGLFFLDRSITKPNLVQDKKVEIRQTLLKNFDSAINLEKISNSPALYGHLYQVPQGEKSDKIVFLTTNLNLTTSESILQSQNKFLPDTVYPYKENTVIVNQIRDSFLLDLSTGKSTLFPDSVYSLTPADFGSKYVFIQKKEKGIDIKEAKNIELTDAKVLATIDFTQYEPTIFQLQIFNNKLFLLSSTFDQNIENIKIYSISGGKINPKIDLKNVVSKKFGFDKMLITTKDETIKNQILSFKNVDKPVLFEYDFRKEVGAEGVRGNILASRCAISNGENKILCLVKKNESAQDSDFYEPDAFAEYQIDDKTTKILFPNIVISANSVEYSPLDEIFIFGQENNLIYKIK